MKKGDGYLKNLIQPWTPRKSEDEAKSKRGENFLTGKERNKILVKYKCKKWDAKDLLIHLANQVEDLKKNQCKPSVACIYNIEDDLYLQSIKEGMF